MSESAFDLENPTEEHRMLRQHGARLRARGRRAAGRGARSLGRRFNVALMRRLGELGLLGVTDPVRARRRGHGRARRR